VRLLAFTDYVYRQRDGVVYGERAFALFLGALSDHVEELTIVGRLDPDTGPCHYALPGSIRFVAVPHYANLTRPLDVCRSLVGSVRGFSRALARTDRVWLLGPYPHAIAFALITLMHRKRLVLGVRQDFPEYVRNRRPTRRWMHVAADLLEAGWRLLALRAPVVVVGPELGRHYRRAPDLLDIAVSLITSADVAAGRLAATRSYDGELTLLSVGRLDHEKNPLLLADVLARLRAADPRWRLVVCGEGPLTPELLAALKDRGVADHAEVLGYVPVDRGLLDIYRSSHAFLHVSLTEGFPQVLLEAFASGLPVVATAVGGVAEATDGAALLIPPSDPDAAVEALQRLVSDTGKRAELVRQGFDAAQSHTLETESARVAAFIANGGDPVAVSPSAASVTRTRSD
jgi:glycosyltransferase involved in cell wall biosynthesis